MYPVNWEGVNGVYPVNWEGVNGVCASPRPTETTKLLMYAMVQV